MTGSSGRPRPVGETGPADQDAPRSHDHDLLLRIAQGDEKALAELYDRWGRRIHDVAHWILGDQDEAEDVVEETFWQIWRTAGRYDWRRASGVTWLALIARSRALDRLRARRRVEGAPVTSLMRLPFEERASSSAESPELQQEQAALHTALVDALAALPAEQRRVLELAFFGGLTHMEVAKRIDQPLGTVKTRIRLAMQKLRLSLEYLRDEEP